MKLALQGRLTFCQHDDRLDLISLARRLGVYSLELDDDLAVSDDSLPALRERIQLSDIEVVALHVPCTCVSATDVRWQSTLDRVRLGLRRAQLLGSAGAVLVPRTPSGISLIDARHSYREICSAAIPIARELGLRLSVNNSGLHASAFGDPEYFADLCGATERDLGMTLDVANWQLGGQCPVAAISRLALWTNIIHLKDWTIPRNQTSVVGAWRSLAMRVRRNVMASPFGQWARGLAVWFGVTRHIPRVVRGTDGTWYQGAMIGDGIVPLPGMLEQLRAVGFNGYLCVEYEGTGDLEMAYCIGVTRIRELLSASDSPAFPLPTDVEPHFEASASPCAEPV